MSFHIHPKSLGHDEHLKRGHYIVSQNHALVLFHQADGNVVLYYGSRALWSTNTGGRETTHLTLQKDGNLVLYHHSTGIWASNSSGADRLVVQNDGNLVLYATNGSAAWASNTCGAQKFPNEWKAGERVDRGEALLAANGAFTFVHQHDGNLVVYDNTNGAPTWSSGTNGRETTHMQVQEGRQPGALPRYRSPVGVQHCRYWRPQADHAG